MGHKTSLHLQALAKRLRCYGRLNEAVAGELAKMTIRMYFTEFACRVTGRIVRYVLVGVNMVPEMPGGCADFMRAVCSHCRPRHLQWQRDQHKQ